MARSSVRKRDGKYSSAVHDGRWRKGRRASVRKARAGGRPGYTRTTGYYNKNVGDGRELKFHDIESLNQAVVTSGLTYPSLNLIAQNTTESGRIGRKVTLKAINFRYTVRILASADAPPKDSTMVRVMVYLDKQANGTPATVAQILESANYLSFNNLSNKGRFRTLYDKTHAINVLTQVVGDVSDYIQPAVWQQSSFYKKCDIPVEFSSTTGVIAEVRSNNVGVLVIGQSSLVAAIDWSARLRFVG